MTIEFRKENLPEFSGESLSDPSGESLSGSSGNSLPGTSRNACSDHSSTSLSDAPFISERDDADTAPRFSVRPACAKDAEAIGRIQAQALEEVLGVASPVDASALADQWEQSLSAPAPEGYQVLVALHASTLVGFALVAPADPLSLDRGEEIPAGALIAELLIDRDFTRSGHASRLLAAIAELSKAENLRAWARPEDEARTKFLHSAGFAPAGIRRTLEKPDGSLLMEHLWWAAVGE